MVDRKLIHFHDLDDDFERRRCFALQDCLLGSALLRFLVGKRHGLYAPDEIRKGRVHQQVFQRIAVRRADQLNAALRDGPGGKSFLLDTNLIDDNDFRHMVFDSFDHHRMLQVRLDHLHSAGASNCRMRDVSITGDFIGSVNNNDPLLEFVGKYPCDFAQFGRLATARAAKHQDRFAGFHNVADNIDRAIDSPSDPAGEANNFTLTVADRRNTVQGSFNPGAVIFTKRAYSGGDILDILGSDWNAFTQPDRTAIGKACFGIASEVHYDFDQAGGNIALFQGGPQGRRQNIQQLSQIIRDAHLVACQRGLFGLGEGTLFFVICQSVAQIGQGFVTWIGKCHSHS